MEFELLVTGNVIDALLEFPAQKRRRYLELFRRIQAYPGTFSQFRQQSDSGRIVHAYVFEQHEIRYWIDWADRHVKILRLVPNE